MFIELMENIKNIPIVLFIISLPCWIFGKSGVTNVPSNFESTSQILDVIENKLWEDKVVTYDLKNVIGSPFYTEEFLPGTLYLRDKDYGDFYFRYNLYRDEIELKKSVNGKLESVREALGISVKYNNGTRMNTIKIYDDQLKDFVPKFFIILIDNLLAKRVSVRFSIPKEAENSLSGKKKARFVDKTDYYLMREPLKKIVLKNKQILKLYPKKKQAISNFIKRKKINVRKEQDLIALFNFINTL